ncbi:hypothetical protein [Croceimicrobium hydrocarbonivorans]|uniref:Uncharacterized protein n=1 Tax=Croceimicrobium hydrocarbonivorans TaxID=2761580 RepID=A0A7H0VI39_9FLAO|nr:hypothetical protein [Croceimicrobium hydrocarbonivorans]QNR25387.1 hypothetical protein H4K34_05970 [Croceimicrobium hydrocarbonivorans]
MKTKHILASLGILLMLISCRKEEDPTESPNPWVFTYDGVEHDLKSGALIHYPSFSHSGAENVDLLLYTKGVDLIIGSEGLPNDASGNGYILYFECYSADSAYLSDGTYTLDTNIRALSIATAAINPVVNGNTDLWFEVPSTQFEVIYKDGEFQIIGSGKDEANLNFDFKYKGELDWYQES